MHTILVHGYTITAEIDPKNPNCCNVFLNGQYRANYGTNNPETAAKWFIEELNNSCGTIFTN